MSFVRIVSTMNDLDDILVQLDRTRFQPKSGRWITLPGLRSESEFPNADAVPYRKQVDPDTNKPSISTITTQVRKKKISKKSTKERIADKSVLLADRLDRKPYK